MFNKDYNVALLSTKERVIRIVITGIYVVTVLIGCGLGGYFLFDGNEDYLGLVMFVWCVLCIPAIIFNNAIFNAFSKRHREEKKKLKEIENREIAGYKVSYNIPADIEISLGYSRFKKKNVVLAIVIWVLCFLTFVALALTTSIFEKEVNDFIEVSLLAVAIILLIYGAFIFFDRPLLGLLHSTMPVICFSVMPLILYLCHVESPIAYAFATIGFGILTYSIFMKFTVADPTKKKKAGIAEYYLEFCLKYPDAKAIENIADESTVDRFCLYKKEEYNKHIEVTVINDSIYVAIFGEVQIGKYKVKNTQVLVEKYEGNTSELVDRYQQYL